jgi:outer membrane lipoprotein-sorting protein
MKVLKKSKAGLVLSILMFAGLARGEAAEDWLKRADEIRNPSTSFEMKVEVRTGDAKSVFAVYLQGQDKTVIVTEQPARDRGRNMLMLEQDFHAYIPTLKRSMKLSLSQKLSGQVANGDISRTRWYGDYAATVESKSSKEIQLLLKAKKKNLTYAAIRLWLDAKNARPLRAEYLALNAKNVLKTASFENYKSLAGAERPSLVRIKDPAGETSEIQILEMKPKKFSSSFFSVKSMESMK